MNKEFTKEQEIAIKHLTDNDYVFDSWDEDDVIMVRLGVRKEFYASIDPAGNVINF
jgi:hypothetical protein